MGGSAGQGGINSGGLAGSGGAAGSGGSGDLLASRPLNVTVTPGLHEHTFLASAADPAVSFNDNAQLAKFDNRAATLMGKLVLTFGGAGSTAGHLGGQGAFCTKRGFHVLAIAAFQDYNVGLGDADFYGDARRQVFEGIEHTKLGDFATIEMVPADGVAQRTQKALQYLHQQAPDEDWGYYLQADGSVRWSDVIFTGVSHGASNSARFAMLVRVSRSVAIAGPRDNSCQDTDPAACGNVLAATWLEEEPATPIERFFALTGTADEQYPQHLFAMDRLGYVGEPAEVIGQQPPYGGSHRLVTPAVHGDLCGKPEYDAACNYAFGVPPENHAGVP